MKTLIIVDIKNHMERTVTPEGTSRRVNLSQDTLLTEVAKLINGGYSIIHIEDSQFFLVKDDEVTVDACDCGKDNTGRPQWVQKSLI